ncbi:hypothetical protein [Leuconostoc citreum]|uniref:hypothetical protein n=1 Tax=Leuconostoc citreum TaxID=33964 RepID=UPI0032DE577F
MTYVYTNSLVPNKDPEQPVKPDNSEINTNILSKNISDSQQPSSKKVADAILPKTAAEKVGVLAIFAVIISAITGGLNFKNSRNKQ